MGGGGGWSVRDQMQMISFSHFFEHFSMIV